jgi:hypothetical protein
MRVYGDRPQCARSATRLTQLHEALQCIAAVPPGLSRHSGLVTLLIDAGMLAQGVADARCEAAGHDAETEDAHVAMALVTGLARCCARSWSTGFAHTGRLPFDALAQCTARLPDELLSLKQPEGYAFYALYPETFFEAAASCRAAAARWQVIGLRSIGTSLSAMVAVGLGAPVPRTLRPVGHPFHREIAAAPPTGWDADTAFALVDEGPGLSGSSLAAVARWLLQAGVAPSQLHFFPSHASPPGPQADASIRALWARTTQHHLGFDAAVCHAARPAHRLAQWVAPLTGPLVAPLQDIGGGAWRDVQAAAHHVGTLPPAHPWQERRKYLAHTAGGTWLLKFAGLGRAGDRALARAGELADAGFSPAVAGLRHGFLVERWRDDLAPLSGASTPQARARLVERMAEYLAFRARRFAAAPDSGASITELFEMMRCNVREALGDAALSILGPVEGDRLDAALRRAAQRVRRVETDNRLHRCEWLVGPSLLLKTDAVDHAAAHDLVGCQDIAWDVAGAEVEFSLSGAEALHLARSMASRGVDVDPGLLALLRPCYLAFQWGHAAMAADATSDPLTRSALAAERDRDAAALPRALQQVFALVQAEPEDA